MRDSYHRNLKKRKSKSGDGASKNKKWKYESQMEFLRPYFQERETRSNFEESALAYDSCNESPIPDLTDIFPEIENSPQSSTSTALFNSITAKKRGKRRSYQLPGFYKIIWILVQLQLRRNRRNLALYTHFSKLLQTLLLPCLYTYN